MISQGESLGKSSDCNTHLGLRQETGLNFLITKSHQLVIHFLPQTLACFLKCVESIHSYILV